MALTLLVLLRGRPGHLPTRHPRLDRLTGVFPSAIAFACWAYALSHVDAGPFSQSTFLVPFITALMAWILLDEVPAALTFAGGALCITGVLVARRTPRAAVQPEPEPEPEPEPDSAGASRS